MSPKAKPAQIYRLCKRCEREHTKLPDNARYSDDTLFCGWHFECDSCLTSFFVPVEEVKSCA